MPAPDTTTYVVHGALLVPAVGASLEGLELRVDRDGITQLGGEPYAGWQIPWRACRDVRTHRAGGVVAVALSFGALRYRWEFDEERVIGGVDGLLALLASAGGARAMVRGVRSTRRRG